MTEKALHSMTGFGRSHSKDGVREILVEIRTVNHRFLKLGVHLPERYSRFEKVLVRKLRDALGRGAVDVKIFCSAVDESQALGFNEQTIRGILASWTEIADDLGLSSQVSPEALFQLPDLLEVRQDLAGAPESEWVDVEKELDLAIEGLLAMRREEGQALTAELFERIAAIETRMAVVVERAPNVLERYRDRLVKNINRLSDTLEGTVEEGDLQREIAIFADRSDINEECIRAGKHLEELAKVLHEGGEAGRKIEFLTQELLREVNTLSSKANDYDISRLAVEIKTEIEKIKEISANIE